MRVHLKLSVSIAAVLVGAVIPSPAGAARGTSGTWEYTDFTPDPTTLQNPAQEHCHGTLPSSPADVNSYPFKTKKTGTLELTSHNQFDWAMEVRDAKGNVVAGTDGADISTPENMTVFLKKGKYEVVYCSFLGEPEITVDYKFIPA
jgi:hypothetical protein